MEQLKASSVVHFYDARSRETLCGIRGFEQRSTKHARGVTCPACVGLLRDRLGSAPAETARADVAAGHA